MFSLKTLSLFAAVAGLQLVAAQESSISTACQSTLASIATSSDGNCLNAGGLISILSGTSSSTDLIPPIDSWAKGMCSRSACTNSTIATVVANVTSGCSADLASFGLQNVDAGQITSLVQQFYPTVRNVLCLADTKNSSTLCATEALYSLEPTIGTISTSNLESLLTSVLAGSVPSISKNATCTDCSKAQFTLISQAFGDLIPSSVTSTLSSECGSSFVDGSMPSSVTQLASKSSVTSTPNGAASAWGVAPVYAVVALASAFAVLA
ncbi:uncharacterized protein BXZ73DRAFT_98914 [Epithele typhae]|uniref:uncharacterized protein n=1 Tax=Epithele typhae TaxID=378194 RepID=UPI0020072457|nr:uncharacterized protein BXZ73DRAFT_98914 [Epithele typhae]KAH9940485.1 hypothetical protein BXZ73DRAFT_98914 [Epithele typhae]